MKENKKLDRSTIKVNMTDQHRKHWWWLNQLRWDPPGRDITPARSLEELCSIALMKISAAGERLRKANSKEEVIESAREVAAAVGDYDELRIEKEREEAEARKRYYKQNYPSKFCREYEPASRVEWSDPSYGECCTCNNWSCPK